MKLSTIYVSPRSAEAIVGVPWEVLHTEFGCKFHHGSDGTFAFDLRSLVEVRVAALVQRRCPWCPEGDVLNILRKWPDDDLLDLAVALRVMPQEHNNNNFQRSEEVTI